MTSRGKVPDAWDDDWDTQPNPSSSSVAADPEVKLSKAERRARQAALNKKLWDEAEAPIVPYFVENRTNVPLHSELKPAVKLLSRKPPPTVVARKDPVSGIEKLTIEDDEDDDDDDESKPAPLTMEERQIKAQKERGEKQKKYEEVRGRLFGTSNPTSGPITPGTVTPPKPKNSSDRGKGRGRVSKDVRPSSAGKQLYDPSYSAKPESAYAQKQIARETEFHSKLPEGDQVIRQPKAPDGSGRRGFGFGPRGGRSGA